jgi:hypothetical protein
MEQSFSQRMGIKPIRNIIQVDSMDDELRKGLWNDIYQNFWWKKNWGVFKNLINDLWTDFFKKLIDEAPAHEVLLQTIRNLYFSLEWNEVYDFIEFIVNRFDGEYDINQFVKACNITLKKTRSAYRIIGKKIVQITSDQEIDEIEEALNTSKKYTQHLNRALELFADNKAPDYRNSIKESISAVEALTKLITGRTKTTLGEALSLLENKLGSFHPALRKAFSNLYGYTNDAQGIRHALLGESELDVEDAKFMLIVCSAFINYLVVKADKAGIELSQIL